MKVWNWCFLMLLLLLISWGCKNADPQFTPLLSVNKEKFIQISNLSLDSNDTFYINAQSNSVNYHLMGNCSESGSPISLFIDGAKRGEAQNCSDEQSFDLTFDSTIFTENSKHSLYLSQEIYKGNQLTSAELTFIKDTINPVKTRFTNSIFYSSGLGNNTNANSILLAWTPAEDKSNEFEYKFYKLMIYKDAVCSSKVSESENIFSETYAFALSADILNYSFQVSQYDGAGNNSISDCVALTHVNHSPEANNIVIYVSANRKNENIDLLRLGNVTDPDGDIPVILSVDSIRDEVGDMTEDFHSFISSGMTPQVNPIQQTHYDFDYSTVPFYNGVDRFSYKISDGFGGTVTKNITVKVMTPWTWIGRSFSHGWMEGANWCGSVKSDFSGCIGGTAPTPTSDIVFNDTCESNCDSNLNLNPTVSGNISGLTISSFQMNKYFHHSVTISGTGTLTVSKVFTQKSGTFNSGSASLHIDETFNLKGGTFNAPDANSLYGLKCESNIFISSEVRFNYTLGKLFKVCYVDTCTYSYPDSITFYH